MTARKSTADAERAADADELAAIVADRAAVDAREQAVRERAAERDGHATREALARIDERVKARDASPIIAIVGQGADLIAETCRMVQEREGDLNRLTSALAAAGVTANLGDQQAAHAFRAAGTAAPAAVRAGGRVLVPLDIATVVSGMTELGFRRSGRSWDTVMRGWPASEKSQGLAADHAAWLGQRW